MAYHAPVLSAETLGFLLPKDGGVYYDGTLGGGGHSEMLLQAATGATVLGVDKDADSVAYAGQRLKMYGGRIKIFRNDFKNAPDILREAGIIRLDGALLDLGISSRQIDEGERGFSYVKDAPLDMRMDRRQEFSAYDLVNTCGEQQLKQIIRDYGEERNAGKIAAAIVARRTRQKIETTAELAGIIAGAAHFDPRAGHPAKRVFQALRIEVNGELNGLDAAITYLVSVLRPGGRICVISFHSLEDRVVKQTFKYLEQTCVCPPKFPVCVCGKRREVKILTHKPVTPTEQEVKENPRAASAKLRAAEKIQIEGIN